MATRFVDARGTEWTVWEIAARPVLADAWMSRAARRSWGSAPGTAGTLCFESATQRRRLERYPRWWEALPSRELAALCDRARPEPPSALPRSGAGSTHAR